MKKIYQQVKDYFTANACRKIFFFGGIACLLFFLLNLAVHSYAIYLLIILILTVIMVASMIDDMAARSRFLHKVKEMQYDHMQEIFDKQEAGENVVFTPTFSTEEKRYIRGRKWMYLVSILFKMILALVLLFLLFS